MKELKFTCLSCGQHIQCDPAHAGENVPCPGCAVLIRVPALDSLADVPSLQIAADTIPPLVDDSEKVSYVPTKSSADSQQKANPAPSPTPASAGKPASPRPAHCT